MNMNLIKINKYKYDICKKGVKNINYIFKKFNDNN